MTNTLSPLDYYNVHQFDGLIVFFYSTHTSAEFKLPGDISFEYESISRYDIVFLSWINISL